MTLTPTKPCAGCGLAIAWRLTRKGAKIPLDPEPVPTGNVILDRQGLAVVLDRERLKVLEARADRERWPRYVSHFATCPNRDQFRRRKGKENSP